MKMKPGTIVRLPDGREGTVVYHGLDGYGIVWGRHPVNVEKILGVQPLFDDGRMADVPRPEAMLRAPWDGSELPCVGDDYVVVIHAEPIKSECEREHFMKCSECGTMFDMRELLQVAQHMHNGPVDATELGKIKPGIRNE